MIKQWKTVSVLWGCRNTLSCVKVMSRPDGNYLPYLGPLIRKQNEFNTNLPLNSEVMLLQCNACSGARHTVCKRNSCCGDVTLCGRNITRLSLPQKAYPLWDSLLSRALQIASGSNRIEAQIMLPQGICILSSIHSTNACSSCAYKAPFGRIGTKSMGHLGS